MAKPGDKRAQLRDRLWPGMSQAFWDRNNKANKGFQTIPKLLPLVMCLINELSSKGDPSSTYLDLWTRAYDEGIASINDEQAAAYSSGYTGARAVRTWHERIDALEELGFIKVKDAGNKKVAHVLILNPIDVVCGMRQKTPEKVPDSFWTAFVGRASEIGAALPGELQTPGWSPHIGDATPATAGADAMKS